MGEKYYDDWEFQQAISYMGSNPMRSRAMLEAYLEKYPKHYFAYTYYASTHIICGDFDKAEEILDRVEEQLKEDSEYIGHDLRSDSYERMSMFTRIKILAYKQKYDILNEEYKNCVKKMKNITINEIELLSKVKAGETKGIEREKLNPYIFKQLFEYKEKDFLDHMKKHLARYNAFATYEVTGHGIFDKDFPFEQALEEVKKNIDTNKALYFGFVDNTYIFKYDNCGKSDHKSVDYFKVVCLHGTKNIVTMYPIPWGADLPFVDLNYMQKTDNNKRPSQIEKFNRRFNRNK